MEDAFFPGGVDLEDRATPKITAGDAVLASGEGRAVKVAVVVKQQGSGWSIPVGGGAAETVENGELAFGGDFVNGPCSVGAAVFGGAVEVPGAVLNDSCLRVSAISGLKSVKNREGLGLGRG